MGLSNEMSLVCCICGCFNFDDGVILKGNIYCWDCIQGKRFKKIVRTSLKFKNLKGGKDGKSK